MRVFGVDAKNAKVKLADAGGTSENSNQVLDIGIRHGDQIYKGKEAVKL